jgi:predicted secreted protein
MSVIARLAAVLTVACGAATAEAGDIADYRILGFTPNGDVFAFEEFGIQDGSGFPYSNIYVVDTSDDSWVPGTPVRVRIDDETKPLAEARDQARKQAAVIFGKIALEDRAIVLAANPLGEYEANPLSIKFGEPFPSYPLQNPPEIRYSADLDLYDAESPGQDCETYIGSGKPQGFRLKITNLTSNASAILHEDQQIPQSRGCPITYRLEAVAVPDDYPAKKAAVVMSLFKPGFEGPDRRFMVVTGDLPQ